VIRTLGKGLVEIDSPQGMAAETSSAAIILTSSHFGMALSTTHVATGSIMGTGIGRTGASVRWSVASRMAIAWLITLPASALVGIVCWWIAHGIGTFSSDLLGVLVAFAILVALSVYMWLHSRKAPVDPNNVNEDWDDTTNGVAPAQKNAEKNPQKNTDTTQEHAPATTSEERS